MNYNISKSRYCSAVQCPKMLWLQKNLPDEIGSSVMNQSVLDTGLAVGTLAMGLFGDFAEVPYGDLDNMISTTNQLIEKKSPVIAEYGGLELTAEAARFYTSGQARFTPPGGHILQ